jgi:hypothetical protein
MKKMTLIFGFALLFGLFSITNDVNGQAIVNHDAQYTFAGVLSTYNLVVFTPSGNATFNLEFTLPEGHPWIPEKGVFKTDQNQTLQGYLVSGTWKVHADGTAKIVLHGELIEP